MVGSKEAEGNVSSRDIHFWETSSCHRLLCLFMRFKTNKQTNQP